MYLTYVAIEIYSLHLALALSLALSVQSAVTAMGNLYSLPHGPVSVQPGQGPPPPLASSQLVILLLNNGPQVS